MRNWSSFIKEPWWRKESLHFFHQRGIFSCNFYPDGDLIAHYHQMGNNFLACIPEYDCLFTPKSYNIERLKLAGAKRVEFLPYAYDPWCHFPMKLTAEEEAEFTSDVAFIGSWGSERAKILEKLVGGSFPYRLSIWGNQWERLSPESPLRQYVKFKPATGQTQAKVFAGTRIGLAFLLPPDIHTARSFEMPAYGAFMLAERTPEHTTFFAENREIACFGDVEELREKINYYLAHDEERIAIAKAGFEKVTTGGHSYLDRMQRVLNVYHEMRG